MEEYILKKEDVSSIKRGLLSERIKDKFERKYGFETAEKIKNTGLKIVNKVFENRNNQNQNLLLVGKVQSGKTSNLEYLTALMFDNDYDILIMYGGYDIKLLEQTYERFKKTFSFYEDDGIEPYIISTLDIEKITSLNEKLIKQIIKYNKKIIIISMKRPKALERINDLLKNINGNYKTFIIDDEGDQASLNTKFRNEKKSSTYASITKMKKILNNPVYFSVTATPHANVLIGEYSELKPYDIVLIPPGEGYCGGTMFHLDESKMIVVKKEDVEYLNQGEAPDSLRYAIYHFILSTCILKIRGINKSDMIIHFDRHINKQNHIYNWVSNFIETLKFNSYNGESNQFIEEIKKTYTKDYFDESIIKEYNLNQLLKYYNEVVVDTYVILQNGTGSNTQYHNNIKPHKIYIGGDLLQRGLTFDKLVTTYFTRWAQKGLMDTIIQRARWFGYRKKYIDLCRIFTTKDILIEFSSLINSEEDLTYQLREIELGNKNIDDIIIDANGSSLIPTRKNVANYKGVSFDTKWKNQRIGIFDKNIIEKHNNHINELINSYNWTPSTIGRRDGETSCLYSYISNDDFLEMIYNLKEVFDSKPFGIDDLEKLSSRYNIVIQLMFRKRNNGYDDVRKRTFDDNSNVSALQQGADTDDEVKKKYEGDRFVIVDKDSICIQVFKVLSKDKEKFANDYTQYMFSIYAPDNYKGFKRV